MGENGPMAGRYRFVAAVLTGLAGLLPLPARAVLPDEIQVYTDDVAAPGSFGMELHVNTTPSGRREAEFPNEVTPHHGLRVTPELTYGFAQDFDAGFYLPMTRDADGRVLFGGPKLRLKWVPLRPPENGAGWFAGANAEYSWLNRNFEPETRRFELRPILGWRDADWLFAFNPVLDWALNGPDKSGRPEFNPSLKAARTVAEGVALGLEYYGGLGPLGRPAPGAEQSHSLYVALDWERGPLPFQVGIGRGFGNTDDDWTVKAIFSFSFF
jgi:hypothetical protein